jgi:hypothetical protein
VNNIETHCICVGRRDNKIPESCWIIGARERVRERNRGANLIEVQCVHWWYHEETPMKRNIHLNNEERECKTGPISERGRVKGEGKGG